MMPLTLIIDTSIRGAAVGILKRGGKELAFAEVSEDIKDSARQLPLMVQRGLDGLGATCSDVENLVVSQGPGSFTGIRVGLAYAYGFGLALANSASIKKVDKIDKMRVLGASSLLVLAEAIAKREQHDVVVFLPATKTSGYAAIVQFGASRMLPVDLTSASFSEGFPENWMVLGEWPQLATASQVLGGRVIVVTDTKDASKTVLTCLANLVIDGRNVNWSKEIPKAIYLRKSSVEEKFDSENSQRD
jgi:tRNA threonylcarbamoyl adenosine modification protein YeaZ